MEWRDVWQKPGVARVPGREEFSGLRKNKGPSGLNSPQRAVEARYARSEQEEAG